MIIPASVLQSNYNCPIIYREVLFMAPMTVYPILTITVNTYLCLPVKSMTTIYYYRPIIHYISRPPTISRFDYRTIYVNPVAEWPALFPHLLHHTYHFYFFFSGLSQFLLLKILPLHSFYYPRFKSGGKQRVINIPYVPGKP